MATAFAFTSIHLRNFVPPLRLCSVPFFANMPCTVRASSKVHHLPEKNPFSDIPEEPVLMEKPFHALDSNTLKKIKAELFDVDVNADERFVYFVYLLRVLCISLIFVIIHGMKLVVS